MPAEPEACSRAGAGLPEAKGREQWCDAIDSPGTPTESSASGSRAGSDPDRRRAGRSRLPIELGRRVSGSEAISVLYRDQLLLTADLELLHGPRVAVRVAEAEERAAVVGREHHNLAALDTAIDQLPAGGLRVGDDELQAPHRSWNHLALCQQVAEDDACAR